MAADPITWSALKTSLANWLDRTDLSTTEIPEAIALAERRFNREIWTPDREASATLTASAETVALPADFWSIRTAYVDSSPRWTLEQVSLGDLRDMYPTAETGKPRHFAIVGGYMHLGPVPASSTSIKLNYYEEIATLSGSVADNWLIINHPDVYLHGSLAELHNLLRDTEGMGIHEAKVAQRIRELNKLGIRKRHAVTPLAPRGLVASVSRYFNA